MSASSECTPRVPGDQSDAAPPSPPPRDPEALSEHVRCVRLGHGANCSSIGSVVDTLFATATVGAAVFAAVVAALAKEPVRVSSPPRARSAPDKREEPPT
ncbi:MAG: hypothetical protein WBY94_30685 [Polyangiaceae bacterium]